MSTVLITGATDGLGRAVARRLSADGHEVLIHGRDAGRLEEAAAQIGAARTYLADLASLSQVRDLAADVREREPRLDVLVNNAGIGGGLPESRGRQESEDGYELRFAVNYLAGFLLTSDLLALLKASAPARIVNVASLGQAELDFDDPQIEDGYSGARAYGQSKLAQITAGFDLAARLEGTNVTVTSLHPGTYMPTKIVTKDIGRTVDALDVGVDSVTRLAVAPELDGVTGRFFDRDREAEPHSQAADPEAQRRLRELSLELTGAPAEV